MLRLLLMIADLIAPVRLLMRRRRLMLIAVELLLLLLALLRRRAVRMFRTAGYRTGTAAVVGRAVHRSVVHGGSETRVPILPTTRRDDETHSGTFLSPAIRSVPLTFTSSYHYVRPLANIATTRTIERGLFQCMLKPCLPRSSLRALVDFDKRCVSI